MDSTSQQNEILENKLYSDHLCTPIIYLEALGLDFGPLCELCGTSTTKHGWCVMSWK